VGSNQNGINFVRKLLDNQNHTVNSLNYLKGLTHYEMESGVVAIDKVRNFAGLAAACKLLDKEVSSALHETMYGDKESYVFCLSKH
jgi:hypothetical protein